MKRLLILMSSWWMTSGLLIILPTVILLETKVIRDARARWPAGEKAWQGSDQAAALADAIEQYCIDFPDNGRLENTREWTDWLAGHNAKGIKYLNVERYSRDSSGRLLDPCGSPWVIEVEGDPGFEPMDPKDAANEFNVTSAVCPGFAYGNRRKPRHLRS
jgi:hypothetical protein